MNRKCTACVAVRQERRLERWGLMDGREGDGMWGWHPVSGPPRGCEMAGGASSPQLGSDQTGRGVPSPPLSAPAGFCRRAGGRGVPRAGASLGHYVMWKAQPPLSASRPPDQTPLLPRPLLHYLPAGARLGPGPLAGLGSRGSIDYAFNGLLKV